MPDASSVLSLATSTLTIKEPAFQDIVILYRRKVSDAPTHDEHDELHENYDKVCVLLRNQGWYALYEYADACNYEPLLSAGNCSSQHPHEGIWHRADGRLRDALP